jgi:SAM-dependent methyltransferase
MRIHRDLVEVSRVNHEKLAELLKCPACGSGIRYRPRVYCYCCEGEVLHAYRVNGEIADLVRAETNGRQKSVDRAFSLMGGRRYEKIITGATAFDRFLVRTMWGTDKFIPLLFEMLDSVAADCKPGFFLDIPVGTGIFTAGEYSLQPNLDFVAADYNRGMLGSALEKVRAEDYGNVMLVRADACNLPFADGAFTGVMTMNGIDAFPNKWRALDELVRVLQHGGKLAGSLYCRGERLLTDILIGHVATWFGWFTRPIFTEYELLYELDSRSIRNVITKKVGPILFFSGRKD